MTGRGRGVLINEILMKNTIPGFAATDQPDSQNVAEDVQTESEEQEAPSKSRSPCLLLGLTKFDNPVPSAGRGLMTPTQFMAPNKLITTKQQQNVPRDTEKREKENDDSGIDIVKEKDLIEAEEYIQKYIPKQYPGNSSEKNISHKAVTSNNSQIKASFNTSMIPNKSQGDEEKQQAEAEWQRFKLQRQISRILSNITPDDLEDVVSDLKKRIDDNTLSSKFPQYSELQVVLETVIDKAIESASFLDVAKIIVKGIADEYILKFEALFPEVISAMASDIVKVTASDKKVTATTKSFCKLLGTLVISAADTDSSFCEVIMSATQDCIEQWTYPDGIGDEVQGFHITKAEMHANAVCELLKQITLGQFEDKSVIRIMPAMKKMLDFVRESVLNEFLPRKIRDIFMDSLLANAWKWLVPGDESSDDNDVAKFGENASYRLDFLKEISTTKNVSESESLVSQEQKENDDENLKNEDDEYDTDLMSQLSENCSENKVLSVGENDNIDNPCAYQNDEMKWEKADHSNADDSDVVIEESLGSAEEEYKIIEYGANNEIEITTKENENDPYYNIRRMMKALKLEDQTNRFESNFIRDSALTADRETLKNLLKESNFPAGLIYEICLYLEKESPFPKQSSQPESFSPYQDRGNKLDMVKSLVIKNGSGSSTPQRVVASNPGIQSDETTPRRKILGIGRGMSFDPAKNRPTSKPQPPHPRRRENQWDNRQTGKQGQHRPSLQSDYDESRRKGQESNWRSSNARKGQEEKPFSRGSRTGSSTWSSPGSRSRDSEEERSLQVGKVQPIQQQSPRRSTKDSNQSDCSKMTIAFDGRPSGCLKCGSKIHYSEECKNDTASLFF